MISFVYKSSWRQSDKYVKLPRCVWPKIQLTIQSNRQIFAHIIMPQVSNIKMWHFVMKFHLCHWIFLCIRDTWAGIFWCMDKFHENSEILVHSYMSWNIWYRKDKFHENSEILVRSYMSWNIWCCKDKFHKNSDFFGTRTSHELDYFENLINFAWMLDFFSW